MTLSEEQRSLLVDYFRARPVTDVYVFGSYARGDANAGSDLDLVVRYDFESDKPLNLKRCKHDLHAMLSLRIDVYEEHRLLKYIRRSIEDSRLLIYSVSEPTSATRAVRQP